MKVSKTLASIFLVTAISLVYVGQQVELYKLSYRIRDNEETVTTLLDQNRVLRYNVETSKSLSNLEKILLAKDVKLNMPGEWKVVRVVAERPHQAIVRRSGFETGRKMLMSAFTLKREAEAKPLK